MIYIQYFWHANMLCLKRFQMSSYMVKAPKEGSFPGSLYDFNLLSQWLSFYIWDMVIPTNQGLCWHYRNPVDPNVYVKGEDDWAHQQ